MLCKRWCKKALIGVGSINEATAVLSSRSFRMWSMDKKIFDKRQQLQHANLQRERSQLPGPMIGEETSTYIPESSINAYDYHGHPLSYTQSVDSSTTSITDGETLFGYLTVKQGEKAAIWSQVELSTKNNKNKQKKREISYNFL